MDLIVESRIGEPRGILRANSVSYPCALGPAGLIAEKREGDGGTPIARMALVQIYLRADRVAPPTTALPIRETAPADGWCDDPNSDLYNQPVQLPFGASHERMWREDHLYDICVILDWNLVPAEPGKGSAIFFHLAREGYLPTEGCIAVSEPDMRAILQGVSAGSRIETRLLG